LSFNDRLEAKMNKALATDAWDSWDGSKAKGIWPQIALPGKKNEKTHALGLSHESHASVAKSPFGVMV
jgi:hypothetical protein